MPRILFTDITVRNLPVGVHFDTKLPSFGMRVGKTRRAWIVLKGDNWGKVTIGHYPAISLHDVRKKALIALASPAEAKPSLSFPGALESFLVKRKVGLGLGLTRIGGHLERFRERCHHATDPCCVFP